MSIEAYDYGVTDGVAQGVAKENDRITKIIEAEAQLHHERGLDASAEYLINLSARIKEDAE